MSNTRRPPIQGGIQRESQLPFSQNPVITPKAPGFYVGNPFNVGPDNSGSNHTNNTTDTHVTRNVIDDQWGPPHHFEKQHAQQQLLFSEKSPGSGMDNAYKHATIPELNYLFDQAYKDFTLLSAQAASNGQGVSAQVGNVKSNAIRSILRRPSSKWHTIPELSRPGTFSSEELEVFDYLSIEGIVRRWAIAGVMLSTTEHGDAPTDIPTFRVYSLDIQGTTTVSNYWGNDAMPGHRLFLLITRRYNPLTKEYGSFIIKPFVNAFGDFPSAEDRFYLGFDGSAHYAHVIFFGFVIDAEGSSFDERLCQQATGEIGNIRENYDAHAKLPLIKVSMHV